MIDKELLQAIAQLLDEKFTPIENRLDSLEKKVDSLEKKFDSLEKKVDSLEKKFDSLEKKVDSLETEKVDLMLSELLVIKARVTNIELTMENDVKKDIKLLAEVYAPAAKKFEISSENIEKLQREVSLLNMVVAQHSEKLKMIS